MDTLKLSAFSQVFIFEHYSLNLLINNIFKIGIIFAEYELTIIRKLGTRI